MNRGRGRAFTLVELLVVLAIIALLIAILMPVLHRARRAAEVLASPIAYTGRDGTVHLTDPTGGTDVGIAGRSTMSCPVCHSPPQWSPSGQLLAFSYESGMNSRSPGATVFAEPVPNRIRSYNNGRFFLGWADSDTVLEGDPSSPIEFWSAGDHRLRKQINAPVQIFSIAATPTGSASPYVGIYAPAANPSSLAVGFLKRDLSPGKVVWTVPSRRSVSDLERARADPLGEAIAWTQHSPGIRIAIKDVREPSWVAPTLIGTQFQSAYFCDWAENGTLLANVSDDQVRWTLAILDRKGRLIRKLAMAAEPAKGSVASWRKYGHR